MAIRILLIALVVINASNAADSASNHEELVPIITESLVSGSPEALEPYLSHCVIKLSQRNDRGREFMAANWPILAQAGVEIVSTEYIESLDDLRLFDQLVLNYPDRFPAALINSDGSFNSERILEVWPTLEVILRDGRILVVVIKVGDESGPLYLGVQNTEAGPRITLCDDR